MDLTPKDFYLGLVLFLVSFGQDDISVLKVF